MRPAIGDPLSASMIRSLPSLCLAALLFGCGGEPPAVPGGALPAAHVGVEYSAELTAESDSPPLRWSFVGIGAPPGLTLSEAGVLTGRPAVEGSYTFTVAATDAASRTGKALYALQVFTTPSPRIATTALPDALAGAPYSVELIGQGGTPPYSWSIAPLPAGLGLSGAVLSGTPPAPATTPVAITLTDALGQTAHASLALEVLAAVTLDGEPASSDLYVGEAYARTLIAQGGTAPLSFSVTAGELPAGITLTPGGQLSGPPTSAGTATATVTVVDASGQSASAALTFVVYDLPVITTTELAPAVLGTPYTQAVVRAGGKAPVAVTVTGALPTGVSWNGAALSGTPQASGDFALTFTATDSHARTASAALTLTVYDSLAITTTTLATAYLGSAYSADLAAIGGAPPYAFDVTSGAPAPGVTLSSAGALRGTPTGTGDFFFVARVTDADARTATRTLTLRSRAQVQVTTTTLPDAYRTASYSSTLAATGGEGSRSWSVVSGSLPAGLTLSTAGTISGTVGAAAQNATFTVRATDANGRFGERTLSLATYPLPSFTTAALPGGRVGNPYDRTVATTGGKGSRTLSIASGALPGGLTLTASTGRIAGTPTTAGTFSFTLQVSDANLRTAQRAFSIEVTSQPPAILEIAGWNVEFFGSTSNGPTDEPLQLQNATGVIADAGFDAWGLAEIVSNADFSTLLSSLPGYAGFVSNDSIVPGGSTYYSSSEQKLAFLYDTSKVQVLSASLILTSSSYEFAGRPPLRVNTRVTVGAETIDLTVIVVHLKSGATTDDRDRRVSAAALLKSYLDTNLSTGEVVVVGDWNDDVDESIVPDGMGGRLQTPFQNFLDDSTDYRFVTDVLSAAGLRSTVSFNSVIDHHLATNELNALHVGPAQVVRPDLWAVPVSNYGTSTSDHYPILSRYDLTGFGGPPPLPAGFAADAGAGWIQLVEPGAARAE